MAAKLLGVSRQRVYELIRQGVLTWCKLEHTVLVGRGSIDARIRAKEVQVEGGVRSRASGCGRR
jgi:excisionase family DNA binding protein